MPTLAQLCTVLGADLAPLTGAPDDREVRGVHVSELSDPTPYLDGGELLLTTGIPLDVPTAALHAYVARLHRAGVAGLGFGLGPHRDTVPDGLHQACDLVGLPLFTVPVPTPFQVIARAYWSLVGRERAAELTSTVGSYRRLVDAALDPSGTRVMRELATAVGGWAIHLDRQGRPLAVWPATAASHVGILEPALRRLRGSGIHSAATFPLDTHDVVVYPVPGRGRTPGFVATAGRRPMPPAHRDLVLTACSLLALADQHRGRDNMTARTAVLTLVLSDHLAAATQLAEDLAASTDIPDPCRVLLVRTPTDDDAVAAVLEAGRVRRLWARSPRTPDLVWAVLDPDDASGVWARVQGLRGEPGLRAAIGPGTRVGAVARQVDRLRRALEVTAFTDLGTGPGPDGARLLGTLRGYRRADLVPAVVAYLRHRGGWEAAALELGVHRNTVRYRVERAHTLTGADLDDPDVAAHLWLAIRDAGLA